MNKWKYYKIGEIVKSISDTYKFSNKEVIFLNTSDISNGKVINRAYSAPKTLPGQAKKSIMKGDLLFSEIRPINKRYARIDFDAKNYVVSTKLIVLRCTDKIDPVYFEYFLTSDYILNHLQTLAEDRSGTFPQITYSNIADIDILLPPLSEQKEIAGILSSLDDKIDLLHRQNKTLEAIAETLFRQWFVEEAEETWEKSTIGEHITTVLGGTPSTTTPEYWGGDIPWINSGEVNNFRIDKPTRYITKLGLEKSNTKVLPKGTTVVAITGATLGQISFLEINTCANQSIVGIIPNEKFPKEFVFFWVKYILQEILLNETGGAQPHINKNDVNEAQLMIPPLTIMNKKVAILKNYFNKITNNVSQICAVEKLRITLLTKLMSGEMSVKHNKKFSCKYIECVGC